MSFVGAPKPSPYYKYEGVHRPSARSWEGQRGAPTSGSGGALPRPGVPAPGGGGRPVPPPRRGGGSPLPIPTPGDGGGGSPRPSEDPVVGGTPGWLQDGGGRNTPMIPPPAPTPVPNRGFKIPDVGGDPYTNTDTGGLSDRGGGGGLQTPMTPPYQGPSYNLQTQNTYNTQQQTSNVQNVQNTENSIRQGQQQRAVGKNTLRPVGAQSYGMGQQMIGNPGYAVQQLKMMNALLGLG